ncbi:MAG: MMPL family transporter [Thermoleophilaceae bacterium]|nr:MMPL family transporter [Thermoleophilaceae bacterium]
MSSFLARAAQPRIRVFIIAFWLIAIFACFGFNLPGKFSDAERNESSSYLPADAESTQALEATKRLQGGEQAALVVVYRREGGLTPQDRVQIQRDLAELNRLDYPQLQQGRDGRVFHRAAVAQDGSAVLVTGNITSDGESETIADPVQDARDIAGRGEGGLEVAVTGPAGYSADAIKVFEQINGSLVGAAFLLVFVLLIFIYRSPILLWFPLIAVAFAEIATRGLGWALTEAGVTVNGQSSSILSVLVLGAGTDYALLLVARYREELRRHEGRQEAMTRALRSAGPAIFASGMTVIAALLTLSVAELNSTASLGPIGALGIAVAMLSMLTFLPATLVLAPRGVFWPRVPHVGDEGEDATHGRWRRAAERIAVHPRRVWIGTAAILLVMALGNLAYNDSLTTGNGFRDDVESVEGQELIDASFPGGANAPTEIVVADPQRARATAAAVRRVEGVADVRPALAGSDGVLLNAVLEGDPYDKDTFALVPEIRQAAHRAGGEGTLVGGASAVEYDVREANKHDAKLIVPLTLLVVLVVLILLLRALVAPLILTATVVLSFAAALGVGFVVFDVVFGFPGSSPDLALFAFVFLVALGIDYNIFLMARVREESQRHGAREGMLRGLAVTGGVITSAGVVLAGTFLVLAVLPLVFLTEIGFVVAFGVLLDTLVVRSILVPALVFDIGAKIWWPSTLASTIDHRRAPGPGATAYSTDR